MLLEARDLHVRYGAIRAVRGISLHVDKGEIVAVLGANGAGKSSLLRGLLGTAKAAAGSVLWQGRAIDGWSTAKRVSNGLVLVPEGRQIFITLSVLENLQLAAYTRRDSEAAQDIEAIFDRFPNLAERRNMPAAVLSGGEQQMLAIGRALLARPQLLMLDEPSLGLSPLLTSRVFALVRQLNHEGIAVLIVEQNTRQVLKIADRAIVIELGSVIAEGTPAELQADDRLRRAYLGGDDAGAPAAATH